LSELKLEHAENILDESLQVAKRIQQDYDSFKAFVLVKDFVDMDYLSTGVSLLVRYLNKFVIFTGGLTAIDEPNSDTNTNLATAMLLASTRPSLETSTSSPKSPSCKTETSSEPPASSEASAKSTTSSSRRTSRRSRRPSTSTSKSTGN
jgi:hypothetical protein